MNTPTSTPQGSRTLRLDAELEVAIDPHVKFTGGVCSAFTFGGTDIFG